jgi:hypothetical protein
MASAGLAWYKTGAVNITQGSPEVSGVGTHWATAGVKTGDMFTVDDTRGYEVSEVKSDTALTLAKPFQGASGTAQNYAVIRNWSATMTAELAARIAELVNKYESYIDGDLNQIIGPKGDPGWSYKGTWASGRGYNAMDITVYENGLYIALISHTSASANSPASANSLWMGMGVVIQNATESAPGIVTLATPAEAAAGTNGTKAMTPLTTRGAIDSTPTGNPAAIFTSVPTATENGVRIMQFNSGTVTPDAGKTPAFELYGDASDQIYIVTTRGASGRYSQNAIRADNSFREFFRQFASGNWSKWRERPTFHARGLTSTRDIIVDCDNGDDVTGNGSEDRPLKTIGGLSNVLSVLDLSWRQRIIFKAGTYTVPSKKEFSGYLGGRLYFDTYSGQADVEIIIGNDGTDVRGLMFYGNPGGVAFYNLKFTQADNLKTRTGLTIDQSDFAYVNNCVFEGFLYGVNLGNSARACMATCTFRDCVNGIRVGESSVLNTYSIYAEDVNYPYYVAGGILIKGSVNSSPAGLIANSIFSGGGLIVPAGGKSL